MGALWLVREVRKSSIFINICKTIFLNEKITHLKLHFNPAVK